MKNANRSPVIDRPESDHHVRELPANHDSHESEERQKREFGVPKVNELVAMSGDQLVDLVGDLLQPVHPWGERVGAAGGSRIHRQKDHEKRDRQKSAQHVSRSGSRLGSRRSWNSPPDSNFGR
jgi:hypothetical protein